ncbi:group 1 glycosyl transferase [Nostoc carneum NIES-2107]|nr:group 1 glycosyl transferase [Nostoc carneum NIES-2107]
MKKNVVIDCTDRHTKIQIISRDIPVENRFGSAAYIIDFLSYLQKLGYQIELTVINSLADNKTPWQIIPPNLARLANVSVKDNLRIGRILLRFNSLSDWIVAPLRLAYNHLLPEKLKNIYRSARNKAQAARSNIKSSSIWGHPIKPEEIDFANTRFVKFKPDVVIANYVFLADVLDSLYLDETVLKVILTHDIRHQRTVDFNNFGVRAFELVWTREKESIALSKAQVLLAIQQEDAKILQDMAPQCEVIKMPKSAVNYFHNNHQVSGRCLFVGSDADHNIHGLQWFLKNVWSIVLQSLPHCSLHVCGSVCNEIKETFPNVIFLGTLDDLKLEYSHAEVCLVPLPIGSGLKIKLVEALSHGRACVSTNAGVQGIPEVVDNAVSVADTAEGFADAIHTLLTNPDKRQWMEEQAHKYVIKNFSPQAVYQPFVDRVEQHLKQVTKKNIKQSLDNILSTESTLSSSLMLKKEKNHEI